MTMALPRTVIFMTGKITIMMNTIIEVANFISSLIVGLIVGELYNRYGKG